MREIKFRAWSNGEEMLQWEDLKNDRLPVGSPAFITLMQYTGLKDKNGVEIYESDRLKIEWCDFHNSVWDKDEFEVEYHNASFSIDNVPLEPMSCDVYEVIGNIYSNPELLGDSHDS